ncbi:MAG: LemA family protein [Nitrospirae bacterium]|nr:LemA family protein [Nitrospirota bacterium]
MIFLALFIILLIIIVPILGIIIIFNSLVSLRNEVQNAWKQIDIQLKRRHDLIPNLVSVVKGSLEFEQDTLERVVAARAKAVSATIPQEKAAAENMLTQSLGRLFAVIENYPALKSNENIMQLQEELTTTENRISFARQLYNDLVANFKTKIGIFPHNIVASVFGFHAEEYYSAAETDKGVPVTEISIRKK